MNERIKKAIRDAFEDLFLPIFMVTWAIGFGLFSIFVVISVLWKIYSFF